jgi:hypothetical protein
MTERDPDQAVTGGSPTSPTPASDTPTETFGPAPSEAPNTPAATSRVEVARPPRTGAARWGIALGVVAVAIGVAAAAAFMLTGQAAPSLLLGYAPAGSVVYTEVRLDLPGDQRLKVGEFLSKFPGFDDQSTLEAKITDVLDRLVREPTGGSHDYSSDIKPWFAGELGMAIGALPAATGDASDGRFLAMASVSDQAAATAWFKDIAKDEDGSTETYAGTELTTYPGPFSTAFAIGGGKVLLVGDVTSVKAALDSGGKSTFSTSENVAKARAAIKGDHLGFMYMDVQAYLDWFKGFSESMGGAGMGSFDESMQAYMPKWLAGALRAEGDGLAFDAVMPHLAINPITENRAGSIAEHLPPSTIALFDSHDLGRTVDASLDLYRDNPATAETFKQVEAAIGVLGGFDAITGWMGDTAIAVTRTDTGVEGGLVIVPTDQAAAQRLVTTLRSFAALGGAQLGVEIRDETYAGATITIVDVDLAQLGVAAGAMGVPTEDGHLGLAYAVTGDAVILGVGPDFVRTAIDAGPGVSLAEDARYRGLVERVGAENAGVAFVDLTAVREMLETLATDSGADMATYEREVKPYLLPFDAFVSANRVSSDLDLGRALITVK